MGVTVWLARWSRKSEEEQERAYYIVVLAILAVAAVVVSLLRAALTFFSLVKVQPCKRTALFKVLPRKIQPFKGT